MREDIGRRFVQRVFNPATHLMQSKLKYHHERNSPESDTYGVLPAAIRSQGVSNVTTRRFTASYRILIRRNGDQIEGKPHGQLIVNVVSFDSSQWQQDSLVPVFKREAYSA